MATIWYYKNVRYDGGVRTGIDINGERILHRFINSSEDEDPALLWFVDVECDGAELPTDPDAARNWLLAQIPTIQQRMNEVADHFEVGIDGLSAPYVKSWSDPANGVTIRIRCSAIHRLVGVDFSRRLREVATDMESDVQSLPIDELLMV
jgi:hypothetical protein